MRAILTYHSIDPSGSPISVSPEAFRRHLDWLAKEQVRVVPLDRVLDPTEQGNLAALTFDDGFANLADEVAPLLADRGWPATVFVVTDHVGRDNSWGGRSANGIPVLPLLGWSGLRRLVEQGFTLGSHTRTHPRLTTIDDQALIDELEGSRDLIWKEAGVVPIWFAYPYGDMDDRVARAVAERYRIAVTTEHREARPGVDRLRVPRIDMFYFRETGLPSWTGGRLRGGLWLRRQARRIRSAVVWD